MRGFTDIQRAAMFYVQVKISYGAERRTYGCNKKNISPEYITDIESRLKNGSGVVIEHKDFENLIKVYDRPNSFFYCDPPYHKTEKYYDAEFKTEDHERLKSVLGNIKGRFILSYNDDEYIRNLYKEFNIISVERPNNLSKGRYKELIIKTIDVIFFRTQITESVICELTKMPSEDRMIRLKLKELLNERKMTQAELSVLTGIRPSTICNIYNNICRSIDKYSIV